jgi:hypothetical protein
MKTKTVIIDFSYICHTSYGIAVSQKKMNMFNFLVLNGIKKVIESFEPNELILAMDGGSWRKNWGYSIYADEHVDTFYKSDRPKDLTLYQMIDDLSDNLRKYFPYKILRVPEAEGDDIIAVLTEKFHKEKDIVIVSRDKDFKQLLKYPNVIMWNPTDKRFEEVEDTERFLFEHIFYGDSIDSVPNILSGIDTIIEPTKRSNPIRKKVIEEAWDMGIDKWIKLNEDYYRTKYSISIKENYERNKKLIELSIDNLPPKIVVNILSQYEESKPINDIQGMSEYLLSLKINALNENQLMLF